MLFKLQFAAVLGIGAFCLSVGVRPGGAQSQPRPNPQSSSASTGNPPIQREKAPSLVDPGGPTISLVSSEPVFFMAAALNACGYNQGLDESAPVRKRVTAAG